ncbi:glycosyltransferase family 4 protein [Phytoactinopolyspora alkaliphila]|uniref:Glycosyltransferase family 4 protein n=1 Tax=Phytoactinopolyspora alkaliphila TaxID=1783498 RepID=A0A6N9YUN1_9ACTN|nr:glycosyltransferase [Phytoactinopolyspora alkaliphila]NED98518.1 glycosyltransferase family 4 protein [Phytoactinopolyspora alkaliphila]
MDALVVFESMFGNTKAVAQSVADTRQPDTVHIAFAPDDPALYTVPEQSVTMAAHSSGRARTPVEAMVALALDHGDAHAYFPLGDGDGGYVVCPGWMHPDGGIDRAVRAARVARKRIVILADVWELSERRYFTRAIEPLLGPDAVFVGDVEGARRSQLLGRAEAVVSPACWEPAVVSMVEALACGTPVVASASSAAAEFIDHGRTGFLCGDDTELATGMVRSHTLDRLGCRSSVVPAVLPAAGAARGGRSAVHSGRAVGLSERGRRSLSPAHRR